MAHFTIEPRRHEGWMVTKEYPGGWMPSDRADTWYFKKRNTAVEFVKENSDPSDGVTLIDSDGNYQEGMRARELD